MTSFTTSSTKNTIHQPINRKKKRNYEDTRDDGFTLQSEGGTPTLFQHRPKIHRLRAIPSGLISPDRTVRSWSNTRIMTDNNPFTAWEVIDFKLWELRELAFEETIL